MSGRRAREVRRENAERLLRLSALGWDAASCRRYARWYRRGLRRAKRFAHHIRQLLPLRSPLNLRRSDASVQWRTFNAGMPLTESEVRRMHTAINEEYANG